MFFLCDENEQKPLVDEPTKRQTAATQYAVCSSKGGIIKVKGLLPICRGINMYKIK